MTKMLNAATATLGNVIPVIGLLMKRLSDCFQRHNRLPDARVLARRLEDQIRRRSERQTHHDFYNMATMCDPRLKGNIARKNSTLKCLRSKLMDRVRLCKAEGHPGSGGGGSGGLPRQKW